MQCSCSRPISGPDSATSSSPAHPFPAQQPHTNTHFWSNFPTFAWFKCKSWSLVYFSSSFEFLDIKYFHVSIHIYSFLLDLSTKGHDSWGLFLETVSSQQQQECTVTQFTPDTELLPVAGSSHAEHCPNLSIMRWNSISGGQLPPPGQWTCNCVCITGWGMEAIIKFFVNKAGQLWAVKHETC